MGVTRKRTSACDFFHQIDTGIDDTCKTCLNQLATEMLKSSMISSKKIQCVHISHENWIIILTQENLYSTCIIPKMKHVAYSIPN